MNTELWTNKSIIDFLKEYFEKKGISEPLLSAQYIVSHVLGYKNRIQLYQEFDRPLNEKELKKIKEFTKLRANNVPIAYILKERNFFGYDFYIENGVLIPRNETEILVETVINDIKKDKEKKYILDLCCGSGIIGLTLKLELGSQIGILLTDIDDNAIKITKINAKRFNLHEKVKIIKSDLFENIKQFKNRFDYIISNPPYISKADYKNLEIQVKEYEPKIALTDDSDGLDFYRKIIKNSKQFLNNNGKLFFEIGINQSKDIKNIFIENNFNNIKIIKDYQNIDRVIYGTINKK